VLRLRGGVLTDVKAMHKGSWGGIGTLVELDLDASDTKETIKQKVSDKVGFA